MFRHAKRIRIDNTGLEQDLFADVKMAQEAVELTENLAAWCEIEDTTTSIAAGASTTVTFAWTATDSDFFTTTKAAQIRMAYVWLTGPNEMGFPTSSGQYEGAFLVIRPNNTQAASRFAISSLSGAESNGYVGAHFNELRNTDVYSYRVFDTNNLLYVSDAEVNGSSGISIEFTNPHNTNSATLNVMGTGLGVS